MPLRYRMFLLALCLTLPTASRASPTSLSEQCQLALAAVHTDGWPPRDTTQILMENCPELLPTKDCAERVGALRVAAPENRSMLLSPCWIAFCSEGMEAILEPDIDFSDQPGVMRDTCSLGNSGLLSNNEFQARFNAIPEEILTHLDRTNAAHADAWASCLDRMSMTTWLNAELMYSHTESLPEAVRERIRAVLREAVLTPWEAPDLATTRPP